MDENTVVKEYLTDEMIEAGARLTEKLDELGLPLQVAMWFFIYAGDQRVASLVRFANNVGERPARPIYWQIEEARKALGDQAKRIPLPVIGLINANDEIAQRLRAGLPTGPGVSRVRFSKNVIGGRFIDDALIYRSAA
ncbi:MAG: hypothetical protein M3Y07_01690 [Acidobacteriota bacterium]|nr:hypothetical protein [Acidobacteriota bacterium]